MMFKVVVGCYEQLVIGYNVTADTSDPDVPLALKAERQFADDSHSGCIKCLAANSSLVVSGSTDETICIYNLKLGQELGSLQGHSGAVNQVLLPSKDRMISCGNDGDVCVWDIGKIGGVIKILKGHKGPVTSFAVHPSGKLGMSVSLQDGSLRTWNMIIGRSAYVKNVKKFQIEFVRWSPDGKYYVTASSRFVQVYELESAKCVREWEVESNILTIEFFPRKQTDLEQNILVVGDNSGNINLHAIPSGTCVLNYKAHDKRVKCVHPFAPPTSLNRPTDEMWLASVSSDEMIKIWKYNVKNLIDAQQQPLDTADCLLVVNTDARLTCVTVWQEVDESEENNQTENATEVATDINDKDIPHKRKRIRKRKSKPLSSESEIVLKKSAATS